MLCARYTIAHHYIFSTHSSVKSTEPEAEYQNRIQTAAPVLIIYSSRSSRSGKFLHELARAFFDIEQHVTLCVARYLFLWGSRTQYVAHVIKLLITTYLLLILRWRSRNQKGRAKRESRLVPHSSSYVQQDLHELARSSKTFHFYLILNIYKYFYLFLILSKTFYVFTFKCFSFHIFLFTNWIWIPNLTILTFTITPTAVHLRGSKLQ